MENSPFSHQHQRSAPITIDRSVLAQTYTLLAVALGITCIGIYVGAMVAPAIITSGWMFLFVIMELAIILTARWWMNVSPLNYVLFGLFPLFSGLSITPLILMVLSGYANGASILINAGISTTLLAVAAAVFAYTTEWNLGVFGRFLFFSLIGLIVFGILQLFIPALQTTQADAMISGFGILVFSMFIAYDIQRIQQQAHFGASPFMLALSLYLDIFNLFLYVLRFMLAVSGRRR